MSSLFSCAAEQDNFSRTERIHVQTDPDKRLRSESVRVFQTRTPRLSSLSFHEQRYELMADGIQHLKYQWDPELIWCSIKFIES